MPLTQYYLAQSLDGYLAESDGSLDWLTKFGGAVEIDAAEATDGAYDDFYAGVGAVALGSRTYEFLLDESPETWPYAGKPSWVFSSRELPNDYDAGIRFVSGPVGPFHEQMREAAGDRNVYVVGGGLLASQFAAEGLLDELILTVVPVVLGAGLPTFASRLSGQLRTAGTRTFSNGMVELRYEFVR